MKTFEEIQHILANHKSFLEKRYHCREIGIFGSYARGEQRTGSDVDILVDFDESISLLKFIEMENYLSDLIGLKVDLVLKDALKPRIGKRILDEVVPV